MKKIIVIAGVIVIGSLLFLINYQTLFNIQDGFFGIDKDILHKRLISHSAYEAFREKYPDISEETFSFCYPNKCDSVMKTTVDLLNHTDKLVFQMSHVDGDDSIHVSIFCTVDDERTKHYNIGVTDIENFTCTDK